MVGDNKCHVGPCDQGQHRHFGLTTRREGNRTIVDTTEKARRRNATFVNDAIAETVEFVRRLDEKRSK